VETLLVAGIVFGAILILCLLAAIMRVIVVWVAKRNGYTPEQMPMHYHAFAFGAYFTILIIIHIVYLTTRTT
jgi:hypothetical protein